MKKLHQLWKLTSAKNFKLLSHPTIPVGQTSNNLRLFSTDLLRRNKPDFELSKMFGVSKTEISNIVVTWINFVADIWSLLNTWPSRELVNFYMPKSFRKHFNATRVIVDGTEIPIQTPGRPDAQKLTFSSYKHKNTLKFLVGASPGGLITYCSGGYAGSASDRPIFRKFVKKETVLWPTEALMSKTCMQARE